MTPVALNSWEGKCVMITTIMASAMTFIDGTALNVVLPSLQKSLHATGASVFWILNAYMLVLASLILIGGSLGDKLGRKKVFMWGILIFIIGSGLCGLVTNVMQLIIFRIVQGIGGALMIPGSLSLISSSINEKERGKAIGTWSSVTTMVTLGGPILGGALGDAGLWRYIFFINIPIGLFALFFLNRYVKEIKDETSNRSLDIAGALSLAMGLALLTFGFLRAPAIGFYNWEIWTSLSTGLLLLFAFFFIEKKSMYPMMPLWLFKNMTFTGTNLLTFFLYAGLGGAMLFIGLNLVQVQGYSQLQSGLAFLPFTILMIMLARYAGTLSDKYGPRFFLIIGPTIAGIGLSLLSFVHQTQGPKDYWISFFPGILVFGFGMSITVAPLTATIMGSVSDRYSGTASGVNNAISRISSVFANAIFGALAVLLFTRHLKDNLTTLNLDERSKQEVMAQSVNLGNATAPKNLSFEMAALIQKQYHEGFIDSYVHVMLFSAILCFLGALMSLGFVKKNALKNIAS